MAENHILNETNQETNLDYLVNNQETDYTIHDYYIAPDEIFLIFLEVPGKFYVSQGQLFDQLQELSSEPNYNVFFDNVRNHRYKVTFEKAQSPITAETYIKTKIKEV